MTSTLRDRHKALKVSAVFLFLAVACCPTLYAQSGSAPASSVFFPRFISYQDSNSGLAIFNPSAREASATVTLTDPNGQFVSSVTVTIPAYGQIAKTAGDLFPKISVVEGSLSVTSSTSGLIAYYETFDAQGTYVDGADSPTAANELIFPVIPGSWEGASEIDLYNPNVRPTAVELRLWSFSGSLLGKATVQVPAGGVYIGLPQDIFPAGTDFSGASHITTLSKPINIFSQAQSVAGTSLFGGFSSVASPAGDIDIAGLNAQPLSRITNAGTIPYFRTGSQYASTLCLANIESASVSVNVTVIANNGVSLGTRRFALNAMGGLRAPMGTLFSSLGFGEREGWILIQSTGRISAAVIYGRSDGGALTAAPIQPLPMTNFIFPQVSHGSGSSMEISVANPGASISDVDIYVVQPAGVTLASNHVTLTPGSRISQNLSQIMPEISSQSGGYIFISASTPVFGIASIWSDNGATVTSLIPQALTTSYWPPALKSFAVTGKVTLNDNPVPGFRVVLSGPVGKLATSNADGFYAFTGLPAGHYSMEVDQFGFQFIPVQAYFELTQESFRQDFQGYTAPNSIVVQPGSLPVGTPDSTINVFGEGFNSGSQVYAGLVRLNTTFIDSTHLSAVIPAYMLSVASRFDISINTNSISSQSFSFVAFVDKPVLSSLDTPGNIMEGSSGTTITLHGTGFLEGAEVLVNGSSDGILVNLLDSTQILAFLPASCLQQGGIYPVTVQNPYPANVESNIQLLTVFYPSPEVQQLSPSAVPARLEPGSGPLNLDILGFGFRRGAVVYLNDTPLSTWYCEDDAYCLTVHLYAAVPPNLLQESGFEEIKVQNPAPSLSSSGIQLLEVDGLQPTIIEAVPGSATLLNTPFNYELPIMVNGTNLSSQTQVRVYKASQSVPAYSSTDITVLSSTQLYIPLKVHYPDSLGIWLIQVANPPPGGGESIPAAFILADGNFVSIPYLFSLNPTAVAAGGLGFTLTLQGSNFKSGAQVQFNTTMLPATVLSAQQATVNIPASLIRSAGRVPVSLINPDDGGASNRLYFDIH